MDFSNSSGFNSSEHLTDVSAKSRGDVVIMAAVHGIICFLGILGNSLVIYIIVKSTKGSGKQTVPDILTICLSVATLLFLVSMPFLIHQLLGEGSWFFGAAICTLITTVDSNCQIISTYILVFLSLDCYVATVHPIRFNHVRTPRVALMLVGVVCLLSLVSVTPQILYTRLMPLPGGQVACALLFPNPSVDIYWFTIYQFILAFALPLAVICFGFLKTLQHMSTSQAPVPPGSLQEDTKKVTRVAGAICSAFFTCWAPYNILQLVQMGMREPSMAFHYTYNVVISMGYANSCVNPVLFVLLNNGCKKRPIVAVRPVP